MPEAPEAKAQPTAPAPQAPAAATPPKSAAKPAPTPPVAAKDGFEAEYQRQFKSDPKLLHKAYSDARAEMTRLKERQKILDAAQVRPATTTPITGTEKPADDKNGRRPTPQATAPTGLTQQRIRSIEAQAEQGIELLYGELAKARASAYEDPEGASKREVEVFKEIRKLESEAREAVVTAKEDAAAVDSFKRETVLAFEKQYPSLADARFANTFRFISSNEMDRLALEAKSAGVDFEAMSRDQIKGYFGKLLLPRIAKAMRDHQTEMLDWARDYDKRVSASNGRKKAALHVESGGAPGKTQAKPPTKSDVRMQELMNAPRPR